MNLESNLGLTNIWSVTCLDKDGNVKWAEEKKNLITTVGLNSSTQEQQQQLGTSDLKVRAHQ